MPTRTKSDMDEAHGGPTLKTLTFVYGAERVGEGDEVLTPNGMAVPKPAPAVLAYRDFRYEGDTEA